MSRRAAILLGAWALAAGAACAGPPAEVAVRLFAESENIADEGDARAPAAAWDGEAFLVAWQSGWAPAPGILARRLRAGDGEPVDDAPPVVVATGDGLGPPRAVCRAGDCLVAWTGPDGVFVRHLAGGVPGRVRRVGARGADATVSLDLGGDGAWVTWRAPPGMIVARRLAPDGAFAEAAAVEVLALRDAASFAVACAPAACVWFGLAPAGDPAAGLTAVRRRTGGALEPRRQSASSLPGLDSVVFAPDLVSLVATTRAASLVIDGETLAPGPLRGFAGIPERAVLGHDGASLYLAGADGSLFELAADGQPRRPAVALPGVPADPAELPALACAPAGRCLVAASRQGGPAGANVVALTFDRDGVAATGDVQVATSASPQAAPTVVPALDGEGWLLFFRARRFAPLAEVRALPVGPGGGPLASESELIFSFAPLSAPDAPLPPILIARAGERLVVAHDQLLLGTFPGTLDRESALVVGEPVVALACKGDTRCLAATPAGVRAFASPADFDDAALLATRDPPLAVGHHGEGFLVATTSEWIVLAPDEASALAVHALPGPAVAAAFAPALGVPGVDLLWTDGRTLFAQALGDDGAPRGPPRDLGPATAATPALVAAGGLDALALLDGPEALASPPSLATLPDGRRLVAWSVFDRRPAVRAPRLRWALVD